MSLLAREIVIKSYFELISMFVTYEARYYVVDHFLDSYKPYYPYVLLSYFLVHKQNLPVLLPKMKPFENVQIAVTNNLSNLD